MYHDIHCKNLAIVADYKRINNLETFLFLFEKVFAVLENTCKAVSFLTNYNEYVFEENTCFKRVDVSLTKDSNQISSNCWNNIIYRVIREYIRVY